MFCALVKYKIFSNVNRSFLIQVPIGDFLPKPNHISNLPITRYFDLTLDRNITLDFFYFSWTQDFPYQKYTVACG